MSKSSGAVKLSSQPHNKKKKVEKKETETVTATTLLCAHAF